ncbi:MAG: Asp-tRNA(Asn)/Glu-tRNA(Gln) amidotransferase subunit GatA [Thaumarchaeota archaeon]|nr:Asp-tRNA(Asn)/Glu-tRNA(Gln) amidotransferase subunit GatA [Nitrososphaerota archaeon]
MAEISPSVAELVRRVASQEVSCEEKTIHRLARIPRIDRDIHAFLHLATDRATKKAREIDRRAKKGERLGRLAGVAIAVKDNICVSAMPATCGSKILEGFVPPYDATVIQRIEAEDGIVLGKTNMDEFAMGNTTQASAFGPTKNPWNLERVPGGSSGGSAAAVSAGMSTLALGTDTGGSVRCPASFCSVLGLKPTYGTVSRYGVIPYANSLEQVGQFARRVSDLALLYDVVSGHDPRDSTSVTSPKARKSSGGFKGKRVGIVTEFFGEGTKDGVRRKVLDASEKFREMGAKVEETHVESMEYALAAYYVIAMAEASSNLSRYDGVRYGASTEKGTADWNAAFAKTRTECFGPEVKRRILLGSYVLSAGYYEAYYLKAQSARGLLRRAFEKAFKSYDILLGPTMPVLPPRIGEKVTPLEDYMIDINTVPANLVGLPALSIPAGFVEGLPVGMQLMAPHFGEHLLFEAAQSYEDAVGVPGAKE